MLKPTVNAIPTRNLSQRQHSNALESGLDYWEIRCCRLGSFTKCSVKPGDYIDANAGECISEEEADRRGRIACHRSYLFHITPDLAIDEMQGQQNAISLPLRYIHPIMRHGHYLSRESSESFFAIHKIHEETELHFSCSSTWTNVHPLVPAVNIKYKS